MTEVDSLAIVRDQFEGLEDEELGYRKYRAAWTVGSGKTRTQWRANVSAAGVLDIDLDTALARLAAAMGWSDDRFRRRIVDDQLPDAVDLRWRHGDPRRWRTLWFGWAPLRYRPMYHRFQACVDGGQLHYLLAVYGVLSPLRRDEKVRPEVERRSARVLTALQQGVVPDPAP